MATIIPNVVVSMPSQLFTMAKAFKSCANGSIYIGTIDTDPTLEKNQIEIYVANEDGTFTQAPQPISINAGGYPVYNGEVAKFVTVKGHSMTILDSVGTQQFYFPNVLKYDPDQFSVNVAGEGGRMLVGRCESIAHLRTIEPNPLVNLIKIDVASYDADTGYGGGEFVYDASSTAEDDGGYIIVTAGGKRWRRDIQLSHLNVTHFGAVADGETDCATAVNRMFTWSRLNYPKIGIVFPDGQFYLSGFSYASYISYFRVTGAQVNFGYLAATEIISDMTDGYLFTVQSRQTEIANISFNGRNNITANTKGFYKNTVVAGQYTNFTNIVWSYVGGKCTDMLDTLDTRFFQCYASRCNGDILYATWSNTASGSWYHITAIEISQCNFQYCTTGKVIDLQRAGQSILRNTWIEHCDNPGTIANGQWIIDALSMEGNGTELVGAYTRFIDKIANNQGKNNGIDTTDTTTPSRWLSRYEMGYVRFYNYGQRIVGTHEADIYSSRFRMSNNTNGTQWFEVGDFYLPAEGDSMEIRFVGAKQFSQVDVNIDVNGGRFGGGDALVSVQVKNNFPEITWSGTRSCPITRVAYATPFKTNMTLYVELAQYTRNICPFVTTTSVTRFENGACFYWNPSFDTMTDDEVAAVSGITYALDQWSMGVGAGIGGNSDGTLLMKGTTQNGYLKVFINGNTNARYIKLETSPD